MRWIGEKLIFVGWLALCLIGTAGYLNNLWTSAQQGQPGYFISGMLFPPFGALRGWALWFGFV